MWQCVVHQGLGPDRALCRSVLGKRTYQFTPGGGCDVDWSDPVPLFESSLLFDAEDPAMAPVRQECDLVVWKPLIDVVVHGKAHAPRGKRARFFDAGVTIAGKTSYVRVFGNRCIDLTRGRLQFSEPELFEEMPLHWGLAYGGTDKLTQPGLDLAYPRNPVGKGFLVAPPMELLQGLPLPNLENPVHCLLPEAILLKRYDKWKEAPVPLAMGWTNPSFLDRQPKDGHPMKHGPSVNAAPAFLRLEKMEHLGKVMLGYMDADVPQLEFQLPDDEPLAWIETDSGAKSLPVRLQNIEIYPASRQVTLLWGALVDSEESIKDAWFESVLD